MADYPQEQLSLYSLMFGNSPWGSLSGGTVSGKRKPGQSSLFNMLPASSWSLFPQQWQSGDDDRSDQSGNNNQPDTGNAMAPSGSTGGPDNTPQSGYDPNTVQGYGYEPSSWMKALSGLGTPAGTKRNANQALNMGAFGLSMLQPRYQ